MKAQLVGYVEGSFKDKETGEVTQTLKLCFVRKPKILEKATGNVAVVTTVYGENILNLPELAVDAAYDIDTGSYHGKDILNDIVKL